MSSHISLIVRGGSALVLSRMFFVFINDPEGPNLLVVVVLAAVLFVVSLAAYARSAFPALSDVKRLLFAVFIQIVMVAALVFWLS